MPPKIDRTRLVPLNHDFGRETPRGRLGGRSVRTGQGQAPRLDRVVSHDLVKVGKGTHVADHLVSGQKRAQRQYCRELKGYSQEVGRLLSRTACNRAGRISAQGLLNSLASLRDHSGKIQEIGGHRYDAILQTRLEKDLASLDHEELLKVYRGTLSEDMLRVRLMLGSELAHNPKNERAGNLLSDLNTLEAMVNTELLGRIDLGEEGWSFPDQNMTTKQLEILANESRRSARERLEMQSNFSTPEHFDVDHEDPRLEHKLEGTGVTVPEFRKVLQQAPLTINFPEDVWFREDSPVLTAQTYSNMWQLGRKPEGENTLAFHRDFIERDVFEPLKEGPLDPDSRPVYAGLNAQQKVSGSSMNYGGGYLVLKPEVKNRCTYTTTDTFLANEAKITEKGIETFLSDLAKLLPKLSQETREGLTEQNLALIRERLEASMGLELGIRNEEDVAGFLVDVFRRIPMAGQDMDALFNCGKRAFEVEGSGRENLTSHDRLERLLANLPEDVVQGVGYRAMDPRRINAGGGMYIEAQVHGEVDFDRDVEKLVVPDNLTPEEMERARQFAKQHGILFRTYSIMVDTQAPYRHGEVKKQGIPNLEGVRVHREPEIQCVPFPKPDIEVQPGFKEFQKELPPILDIYQKHEKDFDPEGLHGRMHICRALIYGRVLANLFQEQGVPVDTHALYRTIAFHDSGREANGTDIYEEDSAKLLKEHLQEEGIEDQDYLDSSWACIDAHSETGGGTVEQGLLRSVDSLDIIRVRGLEKYDRSRLWFMNQDVTLGGRTVKVDPMLREKLIFEVSEFIQLSDPEPLAKTLYYREMEKPDADPQTLQDLRQEWMEELGRRNSVPSEDYFARVEDVLLKNREKFPTLFHYYTSGSDGLPAKDPEIELVVVDSKEETGSKEKVEPKEKVEIPRPDPEILEVVRNGIREIRALPDPPDQKINLLLELFSGVEGGESEKAAGDLINLEINRLLESKPFTMPERLSVTDIRQKSGSNVCYLLSTIASALQTPWGPQALKNMVEDMGDRIKVKFPGRDIVLDKSEIFDIRSPNAPWVQVFERACTKLLGKSMRELGNLFEIPHALGWRVVEIPSPNDVQLITGKGSRDLKKQTLAFSLKERIATALKDGQGVTLMRSGHAVALTRVEGDKLTFFNSLTRFPEERTVDEVAEMMLNNNANIALIQQN